MDTELKSLTIKEMDDQGLGLAKIATLTAIDHDGDTYQAGAFAWKEGGHQWVPILPSHDRCAMPLGKARVYEADDAAYAEIHLNMKSEAGREWHAALKFDLEKGNAVQEWSYGFGIIDRSHEVIEGQEVRRLKRLDVHEVSPVVRGAGIGTGTLALKSHRSFADQIAATIAAIEDIVKRAGDVKALREADGRPMSKARLDQLANLKQRLDVLLATGTPPPDESEDNRMAAMHDLRDVLRRHG
ncbi:HK97 family phage prohead protease [Nitratireductor soli]|uniref:HK97 family phage prohead protease n=1 Tax=Nitratireductor soli TaxID=1670619 RepID=UPI00065E6B75|nr:HK97 family phage prohead protease [Nitratireductor soli]